MQLVPFLSRHRTILGSLAAFFVIGFLLYGWSLNNAFVRWDDGMLIYENPAIRQITPSSIKWIFTHFDPELYIPLTFLSYQIDYLLGGIEPFQYHLTSLVLHILNALLVSFTIFALLRNQPSMKESTGRWVALFCGLIFLVHPINTEGVEWASGRKDMLSTFFMLASVGSYFLYRNRDSRSWYIVSIVLFLCGLLSKVMIITLPVVLMLFDYAERRRFDRRAVLEKLPYFGLSIIFGLVGIMGKEKVLASTTVPEKMLMAFKSMAFYVQQFVWPFKFSLLYPYTGTISATSPDFYVPMLFILLLLLCAVLLRNRQRLIAIGIVFFAVTVGPTLLNFAKGEMDMYIASDRYVYVPQIGFLLILACIIGLLSDALQRRINDRFITISGSIIGLLLIIGMSVLAYRQTLVWTNTRTLFENVITQYPDASYVAYNNLCNAERLANDLDIALEDCQKSLELRQYPQTYSNLAAVYRKQKKYDAALETYELAIQKFPDSRYPYFGIGIVYAEIGQYAKAEEAYKKAIALWPSYMEAHLNLGALYAEQVRYAEAVTEYQTVLRYNAFHPTALFNLGVAQTALGKTDEAMQAYAHAIATDSRMIIARINLAILLHTAGDIDAAVNQFRAVLAIDPDNATALSALRQLNVIE